MILKDQETHEKIVDIIRQLTAIDKNARIHIVISQRYYYKMLNEPGGKFISLKSFEREYDVPICIGGDTADIRIGFEKEV